MEIIKIDMPELQVLEDSRAKQIKNAFEPMTNKLSEFEIIYEKIIEDSKNGITDEIMARAKRARLDISKVRIETGKLKDKQKEYIKLEDKAIMGVHNILVWAVKEKEDNLKNIEDYHLIIEKERIEKLQKDRAEKLMPYLEDAHDISLWSMPDDVWEVYFETKKKNHNDKIEAEKKAKEEAERLKKLEKLRWERNNELRLVYSFAIKGEQDYKLEEMSEAKFNEFKSVLESRKLQNDKEQELIKAESDALKKLMQEREAKAKEEKAKLQKEVDAKIAKEKAEADALKKLMQEREAKAKEEKEKLQKELNVKISREKAEAELLETQRQAELAKGDSEKVIDLIADLEWIKRKYVFDSDKSKKMYSDVCTLLDKVINHINK